MRYIIIFAFVFISALQSFAQTDSLLTVKLTGVTSSEGHVLVALYDKASDWTKPEVAKYTRKAPAQKGAMLIDFAHLAPGKYAVAVLHDEDDSGKMTFSAFGMPKEVYGFSNDARGLFGPPSFEDSLITFGRSGMTTVNLK